MKTTLLCMLLAVQLFVSVSCKQPTAHQLIIQTLKSNGAEQTSPWLTTNNKGAPVLCWTEKEAPQSAAKLVYSVYNTVDGDFGTPVAVPGSEGAKSSPEAINKVAFKSDGTVIALFAKPFQNEKNPYAGAIYYSMSSDNGHRWTPATYIHSDTSHVFGRAYFDVATLKNGEAGAIWLDGRFKNTGGGSAIFFASTGRNKGFSIDKCISKGTCECCRTELLADDNGTLHIAYRSIMFPEALMGKQARDMVYCSSSDNGTTFSERRVISQDNWAIDGCPHTGPSLAVTDKGISAVWFSGGGGTGLYFATAPHKAQEFGPRSRISTEGRHPQLVSLKDGRLAMVCEEVEATGSADHQSSHKGSSHHMDAEGGAKIVLRIINDGNTEQIIPITDGKYADHHPVAVSVNDHLLIAWSRESNGHSAVCFSSVSL